MIFFSPNQYESCLMCDGLGLVQDSNGFLHECDWCSGSGTALNPFYVDEEIERNSEQWRVEHE
ncbi:MULTISPECIES: hypothetical protein [Cyanophyceae]|uniref:hypothetical protein n=1 Tax=Cyanophyceae TaxID=3028117 RepID=UPI001681E275|nr:hypothetical protein [Trichocoleus sp. FACHB-40]MBD2006475.1 hypothetical protein [Trichocoleus sp. FACHB-40]